jgi:hypothetical protein
MKKKTVIKLIGYIVLYLFSLITSICGFAELFKEGIILNEVVSRIPVSIALFVTGLFTFVTVFMHAIDHKTWQNE